MQPTPIRELVSRVYKQAEEDTSRQRKEAGMISFADAESGFVKVGWDLYKKTVEPDAGSIWTVADLDGEKWLVVYTDSDDHIVRSVRNSYNEKRKKTASIREAAHTVVGDIAEIVADPGTINYKYNGAKGEVVGGYNERSRLAFNDGYTMWVENKDLRVVKPAELLSLGDNIRLKKNSNVSGVVIGFNNNIISFKSKTGQIFKATANTVNKLTSTGLVITVPHIQIDPGDDPKVVRDAFKNVFQQGIQPGQMGQSNGMGEPDLDSLPGTPPSIKKMPSPNEISNGTSMPASNFSNQSGFGPPSPGSSAGQSPLQLAAKKEIAKEVFGRVINPTDVVQNKKTGQQGTVIDVRIDRKMGKYYIIDFGDGNPQQEFETNLMKISKGIQSQQMMNPFPEPSMTPNIPGVPPMKAPKAVIEKRVVKADGASGLETLRGGGTSGVSNVDPLSWETGDKDSNADPKKLALEKAIQEELDIPSEMNDIGKITIEIDPRTRSVDVNFGDELDTKQPSQEVPNEEEALVPGSPSNLNPPTINKPQQGGFQQQDIGVQF